MIYKAVQTSQVSGVGGYTSSILEWSECLHKASMDPHAVVALPRVNCRSHIFGLRQDWTNRSGQSLWSSIFSVSAFAPITIFKVRQFGC